MISYIFSEEFNGLNSKPYLDVYESQNLNHQDYFHHPSFQHACFTVFSKYGKCYLLSVYKFDKLIGYIAFRTSKVTLRKRTYNFLVPIAYKVAEYNYPVIDKRFINDFLVILNEVLLNFNVFFHHTPGFYRKKILKYIDNSFIYNVIDNPILRNMDGELLKASKKSTPVKKKRRLARICDVEIKHLTIGIEQEILDSFYKMHIKRWEKDAIGSKFKLKEFQEIYNIISKLKIDNVGGPIFSYLKADGEYLSMQYSFISNKRYLSQISAYKQNNKTKSAGSILVKEILEHISEMEIEIYDMGVGLEAYKNRFMNDVNTYFNITRFKNSFDSFYNRINLK